MVVWLTVEIFVVVVYKYVIAEILDANATILSNCGIFGKVLYFYLNFILYSHVSRDFEKCICAMIVILLPLLEMLR